MNAEEIIAELHNLYPGAHIKQLPDNQPTEIICEFDPGENHPDWSMAVAIIDKSQSHFHKTTREVYRVLRGALTLHVGHQEYVLYEGQQWEIAPGTIHWAEGDAVWVEVYCEPAYSADDHHLADL